uniref:Uncharacterized protein n=1 Tax=Chromera velia CCMP2878 TaxID=1169474 RepID=A0A0G4HN51_9ALVE|eukprot:Cvel_7562.t1-p1 / transcript=Cvel_7562.t1 / gene=Cvel_7562 / organism=Chromera_velia_CCMP2878 / gene_product=hypothetical protein / transcript_product=hypothetical protein / location=Cvel_scaffold398:7075-9889(-) / protein_length=79 / sequence_SO=supercontig / SO=protein_coding / is_pseudo=false
MTAEKLWTKGGESRADIGGGKTSTRDLDPLAEPIGDVCWSSAWLLRSMTDCMDAMKIIRGLEDTGSVGAAVSKIALNTD